MDYHRWTVLTHGFFSLFFLFGFLDDIAQMIPTFTPYEFAML